MSTSSWDTHIGAAGPEHAGTRRQYGSEDVLAVRIGARYRQGLKVATYYLARRERGMAAHNAVCHTADRYGMSADQVLALLDYMGINLRTRSGL